MKINKIKKSLPLKVLGKLKLPNLSRTPKILQNTIDRFQKQRRKYGKNRRG